MKNIFFTNLCWRNCESCPPEHIIFTITDNIILTNGTTVCEGYYTTKWYRVLGDGMEDIKIQPEDLKNWWWADVMKHIRREFEED